MRSIVPFCLFLVFVISLAACTAPQPTQTPDIPATPTAQVEAELPSAPVLEPTAVPNATPHPTATPRPTVSSRPTEDA